MDEAFIFLDKPIEKLERYIALYLGEGTKVGNEPVMIPRYCPKLGNEPVMIPQYCPKVCNAPASFVNSRGAGSFFRLHNYFVYLPVYLTRSSSFYTFTFLLYIIKKQKEQEEQKFLTSPFFLFFFR